MNTRFYHRMTTHALESNRFLSFVFAVTLLTTASSVFAQETDCLYEFNKAYANNEYGTELIQAAQRYLAENQFDPAKTHYQKAIETLKQTIQQYENLPKVAFDCSPANLTIAKNNIRIAQDNLRLANESLLGIDCYAEIGKLEELSGLASDYYYKHNDPVSAQTAAQDALNFGETIKEQNICIGSYRENLDAQIKYAQKVFDSLKTRESYDKCEQDLASVLTAESRAKQTALTGDKTQMRNAWSEVYALANKALQSQGCQAIQRSQLQSIRKRADDKIKSY